MHNFFRGGKKPLGHVVEARRKPDATGFHAAADLFANGAVLEIVRRVPCKASGERPHVGVGHVGDHVLSGAAIEQAEIIVDGLPAAIFFNRKALSDRR